MNATLAAQPGEVMKSGKCERKLDSFDDHEYVCGGTLLEKAPQRTSAEELLDAGREERESHPHQLGKQSRSLVCCRQGCG